MARVKRLPVDPIAEAKRQWLAHGWTDAAPGMTLVTSIMRAQQILLALRASVFEKLQRLSFAFYDAGQSSSIINRAAGDVNAVRSFVDGVIIKVSITSLTLAINTSELPDLVERIRKFRRGFNEHVETSPEHRSPDEVYSLSIQLFRLTKKDTV